MNKKSPETNNNNPQIEEWKITDNRFVAFFDILGFKDKVMRKSHDEIFNELKKISDLKNLIENAQLSYFKDNLVKIKCISFSDSIAIFSKDASTDSFKHFLITVRAFMANSIKSKIMLKGGISHGKISVDHERQIYFGQPIIDAFHIEEDVNYLGVVAHNSINKYLKTQKKLENDPIIKKILTTHKTPLKCGGIWHINIDWFIFSVKGYKNQSDDNNIKQFVENIEDLYSDVSGSPRRYIDNTISFFNECVNIGQINLKSLIEK